MSQSYSHTEAERIELVHARARIRAQRAAAEPAQQIPQRQLIHTDDEHADGHTRLYAALRAAGHNVWLWQDDPSNLRAYAEAVGFKPGVTTQTYVVRLADPSGEDDTEFIGPFVAEHDARRYAKTHQSATVDAYVEPVLSPRSQS
jgi:hypothetical protein